jgi:hypothetical protein
MLDLSVKEALANAEHLKALGETLIYVHRGEDAFPYDKVSAVESGSSYRLGGPSSCYLIAQIDGLTFKLNVDFEPREANGRGVAIFDRDRLRDLMLKLPPGARRSFASLLENECLPGLAKRADELRSALREQADSEDCVRGLIRVAAEQVSE